MASSAKSEVRRIDRGNHIRAMIEIFCRGGMRPSMICRNAARSTRMPFAA